jgi:hypothetical protein
MRRLGALGLAAALVSCYSPNPESGALFCADGGLCPEGYTCSQSKCWKGSGPAGTGGATGTGGASGRGGSGGGGTGKGGAGGSGSGGIAGSTDAGINPAALKFEGQWVFAAGSSVMVSCSDGSSSNIALVGDTIPIVAGATADIIADYYCPWNLNVASNGTSTNIVPGQSCQVVSSTNTLYTYFGDSFALSTSDGASATLNAKFSATYQDVGGATGTCTLQTSGTLTKSP